MRLYPVNLNLNDRLCVVVGGGRVACRKVRGLCEAGAQVRLISPKLVPELAQLVEEKKILWHARVFRREDLCGATLAFAATDSLEVQKQVCQEAESFGIPLNLADQPQKSGFHVPGHFRRGEILVSVSTGGQSPALAAELRRLLEGQLGEEYAAAASFLGLLRREVLSLDSDARAHGRLFKELVEGGIVERIVAGDWDAVLSLLSLQLPASLDGKRFVEEFLGRSGLDTF